MSGSSFRIGFWRWHAVGCVCVRLCVASFLFDLCFAGFWGGVPVFQFYLLFRHIPPKEENTSDGSLAGHSAGSAESAQTYSTAPSSVSGSKLSGSATVQNMEATAELASADSYDEKGLTSSEDVDRTRPEPGGGA
jgi:hypothetical protein